MAPRKSKGRRGFIPIPDELLDDSPEVTPTVEFVATTYSQRSTGFMSSQSRVLEVPEEPESGPSVLQEQDNNNNWSDFEALSQFPRTAEEDVGFERVKKKKRPVSHF